LLGLSSCQSRAATNQLNFAACLGERDVIEPWHEEACKLRKQGLSHQRIAVLLGKSRGGVRWAVEQKEREAGKLRRCLSSDEREERAQARAAALPKYEDTGWVHLLRPSPPKQKPVKPTVVPQEEKMAACVAFARGKITRDELMRRITPPELRTAP
jgi:hypothetical protein